ncbi:MAG: FecR family protein [Treponema sp.]|jgi:hypothetical protein|nr:FecR family protein [Treponema sp.]
MEKEKKSGIFRLRDFLVIALCLSGAVYSLNMFRIDLLQTFHFQEAKPIGAVTEKNNTVQRRMADRVVWDRLINDTPIYTGDLIRVPQFSSAVIVVGDSQIELNENTLVHVQEGRVELNSGSLIFTAGYDEEIILIDITGRRIEATPGTVFRASAEEGSMVLQVSEGAVRMTFGLTEDQAKGLASGPAREVEGLEMSEGMAISLDASGTERMEPMAVVTQPRPHARYIKSGTQPAGINFAWNRIKLMPGDALRLDFAEDRNFNRIVKTIGNLDSTALAELDTGLWHWRLNYENLVLSTGQITVIYGGGPVLLNPAMDSVWPYSTRRTEMHFRWAEIEGASYYLLEVSESPDFFYPRISSKVWGNSFISSSLGPGIWFWRVQPVFPSDYEGAAGFSGTAHFRIEDKGEMEIPVLKTPSHDALINFTSENKDINFSWEGSAQANSSSIQIAQNSDFQTLLIDRLVRDNYYTYLHALGILHPGQYYWRVFFNDETGKRGPASLARSFTITEIVTKEEIITLPVIEPVVETPPPPPKPVTLTAPAAGAAIPGLTALRQQTIFRWSSNEKFGSSRFILSRNPNPLQGRPAVEIKNPGLTASVERLEEGIWYWTVEAFTPDGISISAAPRQLRVLPIPLLPETRNRMPANGHVIKEEQLRNMTNIVFNWSAVEGANAYIYSLYHLTEGRRRLVLRSEPAKQTNLTLSDLRILDQGTFFWQVEALYIEASGRIVQRGRQGENSFVIDMELPGRIKPDDPGVLYGN